MPRFVRSTPTILITTVLATVSLLFANVVLAQPDPASEAAKGLGGVLASFGGYGLSAVLMLAIAFQQKKIDALFERVVAMVEKQSTVIAEVNLNAKRHNDLMEKFLDRKE